MSLRVSSSERLDLGLEKSIRAFVYFGFFCERENYMGTVWLGSFPQTEEGIQLPIEWDVVDHRDDGAILLVSKMALVCMPYNRACIHVSWEKSTLRQWLNHDFFHAAFSQEEQKSIVASTIKTPANTVYYTDSGKATEDKVFILSSEEMNEYRSSGLACVCEATEYAEIQGALNVTVYPEGLTGTFYWLRNAGNVTTHAVLVDEDGDICYMGCKVSEPDICVRPALWAKTKYK